MPRKTDRNLLVIGDEQILFEPGKMLLSETIAMEKATGLTWPQILVGLNTGQMQATRVVVWIMRKRHNPRIRLEEIEFSYGEYHLKDPDFHPDYWIPEGDDDVLISEDGVGSDDEPENSEDPKAEAPQDKEAGEPPED
jgi:hypothetical protein